MTKIDIISGFLGAGKTTLINRLIHEAYEGEKIVLIENEFGQIGIDSGFLKDSGVEITEMNSGCICCSLVGDFSKALKKVVKDYSPDRILIEPSGVGKLSDVTKAVVDADIEGAELNSAVVVVDVNKCKMYMKNFGEFFNDQIVNAGCILFSHTDKTTDAKLSEALALVREQNPNATIVTTPANELDIHTLIEALEQVSTIEKQLKALMSEEVCPVCAHHHHNDHEHDHEECHCHEHDHHHDHEHEHHHEHHQDDCHCHDHEHHHHHHADDVFTSWGRETVKKYSKNAITDILNALDDSDRFGMILRAKGIVASADGNWIHFDYVPGEADVRNGVSAAIGKICVIGAEINEDAIADLFEL
jgi:G3E family GTPase